MNTQPSDIQRNIARYLDEKSLSSFSSASSNLRNRLNDKRMWERKYQTEIGGKVVFNNDEPYGKQFRDKKSEAMYQKFVNMLDLIDQDIGEYDPQATLNFVKNSTREHLEDGIFSLKYKFFDLEKDLIDEIMNEIKRYISDLRPDLIPKYRDILKEYHIR